MIKAWWTQFWGNLSERDQSALSIGGIGLGLYLAYAAYAPLKQAVLENTRDLAGQRATLLWMKAAESRFTPDQKKKKMLGGSSGLTAFSSAISQSTFHELPYQLQQVEEGVLQLSFETVPYQHFLTWLWSMEARYVLHVKTFNAEKTDTKGLVKLTLTIVL
jgi:general secretion pathway protein M